MRTQAQLVGTRKGEPRVKRKSWMCKNKRHSNCTVVYCPCACHPPVYVRISEERSHD